MEILTTEKSGRFRAVAQRDGQADGLRVADAGDGDVSIGDGPRGVNSRIEVATPGSHAAA
jgi:hypothetical protein